MLNIKRLFSTYKDYVKKLYKKKTYVKQDPEFDGKNVDNISVFEFYIKDKKYIEDRVAVFKFLKPKGVFTYKEYYIKHKIEVESFEGLSFSLIKQLQPIIRGNDPITEVVLVLQELLPNKTEKEIKKMILKSSIIDFFYFYNFINEGVTRTIDNEGVALSYEPTATEDEADLSVFNKFGVYGTVRGLSENILDDDKVLELPYNKVFTILLWKKTERDYQKRLTDIHKRKQKQK